MRTFKCFLMVAVILVSTVSVKAQAQESYPSLEKQFDQSNGIIQGTYNGLNFRKDSSGNIVSDLSFKVLKSAGIPLNRMINSSDFKVTVPGGKWLEVDYQVEGTPVFEEGEEVIIFVKLNNSGVELSDLTVGKYRVLRVGELTYIQLVKAPDHKELGRIKYSKISKMAKYSFGKGLQGLDADFHVAELNYSRKLFGRQKFENLGTRKIASLDEQVQKNTLDKYDERSYQIFFMWFILIFFALFAISRYIINKGG